MEEVDLSFLDGQPLPISDSVQRNSELEMLKELAGNVGQYDYEYTEDAQNDPTLPGANAGEYLGIMAQDLLKIPGLATSVNTQLDGNGNETYTVDGNRLALAALGYVAALSRIVLDMRGIKYDNSNTTNAQELRAGTETTEGIQSGTAEGGTTTSAISGNTEGATTETTNPNVYESATNATNGLRG